MLSYASNKKIRIAHLASFRGNIGDVVNHLGFRKWFSGLLKTDIEWFDLEIRDFYRGFRKFDVHLVAELNSFDLVVIGGGNYFELWPENTRTGCSIDLPEELLKDIHPPIFFNALGVDDGQGVGTQAELFFAKFIRFIYNSEKYLISFRNDGAVQNIKKNFPELHNLKFNVIPDHGFFALDNSLQKDTSSGNNVKLVIGLNLAQDMIDLRFKYGKEKFLSQIRNTLMHIGFDRLILFPHIPSDIEILYELIYLFPDLIKREKISLSPFGNYDLDIQTTLQNYSAVDVMLAMRFHANVLPLSVGTPTIGISSYPQISKLYEELGMQRWSIDVNLTDSISQDLKVKLKEISKEQEKVSSIFQQIPIMLRAQRANFEPVLKDWLGKQGFV